MLAACFEIFYLSSLIFSCCSTRLLFTLFDDDSFVPDYSSSRAFAILYSFVFKTFFFWCSIENTIQTFLFVDFFWAERKWKKNYLDFSNFFQFQHVHVKREWKENLLFSSSVHGFLFHFTRIRKIVLCFSFHCLTSFLCVLNENWEKKFLVFWMRWRTIETIRKIDYEIV